jgi:glycosyltransferase involved in cell wall biosynthesis
MLPHILSLSSSRSNGGAERHLVALAAGYQALGGKVTLACAPESFIEQTGRVQGLSLHPFQLCNSGDLRAVLQLKQLVQTSGAQLIHCHARRDFVTATLAGRLTRCPVLLHVHVVRPLGEPHRLAGRFFNQASAIVAVSDFARSELERWHQLRPGLTRRLYNGIDTKSFLQTKTLREAWKIPADSLVVGMVGRLSTKGQLAFLPIAARLAKTFPTLQFVFVGPDDPALRFSQFQEQLDTYGLQERSRMVGMCEQVPEVMRSLDILVHLPTDEAFGLALVEAGAAGVPVVASDVGGCREVVCEATTGFLVPPNRPEQQEDLLRLLLADPSLRRQLGHQGQQRAQTEFSTERQLAELCALYQELT